MRRGATEAATEAARSNERAAGARVGLLFEEHGRMVYALCRMILRSAEDAEDATQQTFLRAHRSLCAGTVVEQPAAWLATVARNECYNRASRRTESVLLQEADSETEDAATVAERRAEIEALCVAVSELPQAQRDALVLREFYGLSYREVAAAIGVSGPAVESLIFKSRRRLQEKLGPIRAASSVFTLPLALRDGLAAAIPGFVGGAEAAAGGAVVAKLAAAPLAAKLAAVVVAIGAGTAVSGSSPHRSPLLPEPVEAAAAAPRASARPAPQTLLQLPVSATEEGEGLLTAGTEDDPEGRDDDGDRGPRGDGEGHEPEERDERGAAGEDDEDVEDVEDVEDEEDVEDGASRPSISAPGTEHQEAEEDGRDEDEAEERSEGVLSRADPRGLEDGELEDAFDENGRDEDHGEEIEVEAEEEAEAKVELEERD